MLSRLSFGPTGIKGFGNKSVPMFYTSCLIERSSQSEMSAELALPWSVCQTFGIIFSCKEGRQPHVTCQNCLILLGSLPATIN